MPELYFTDRTYTMRDLVEGKLPEGEYDGCVFEQLVIPGADLSRYHFLDCSFIGCNLGNVRLRNTSLKNVLFKDCKLTGMPFRDCHPFLFKIKLEQCKVDLASFHGLPMKETFFHDCDLHEADFSGADLTGSTFNRCDLSLAQFEETNLEKCDLRTALNFIIDPEKNRIRKCFFSLSGLTGLLGKYDLRIEP